MNNYSNPDRPSTYGGGLLVTLVLFVTSLVMTGCIKVGPDYQAPTPVAPDKWHSELQGGLQSGTRDVSDLSRWWESLQDPLLVSLEQRALRGNPGLNEARARVNEARAMRGLERTRLFPAVDAEAAATKAHSSASGGSGTTTEHYSTGLDAGWELDLFGGTRRAVEAAQASLEASEEELHGARVSLLAEVALNYIAMRTYQARLQAALANLGTLDENYNINGSRYRAGLIPELSVHESERLLESARARVPGLEAGLNATKNRLAVLLGEPPGSLHDELGPKGEIPGPPRSLVIGIPAETLRNRPDVRKAERELAAQTAKIGVATADLYPKLSLSGTLGLEAISAGDLFESTSRSWSIGPGIRWNIFDAGAVRKNIEIQNARQEKALVHYESTVLDALEEVENSLVSYAKEQLRRDSLARATAAAERAEQLARDQYRSGLVAYNNVLDAQRSAILLRDELAQSNGAVTANLVRLYKAFGGGWQTIEETAGTKGP